MGCEIAKVQGPRHSGANGRDKRKSMAARFQRKYQWPAETVLSKGHRLVGVLANPSEHPGAATKRAATSNLGSRRLLNIEKRSVPSFKLRGVGLASKNAT